MLYEFFHETIAKILKVTTILNVNKKEINEFKFIDLFCGIGGFHIALSSLGGKCVFASDIDKNCRDVYENNFKIIPKGDITKIDPKSIPSHDVLAAGFPCQPFSKGGQQKGFLDQTRGTLFFNILNIIVHKKPKFILLENVRNLSTHDNGNTWSVIIKSLQEQGYKVNTKPIIMSPHKISPNDGGAPQIRERVLILGKRMPKNYKGSLDWDIEVNGYPSTNWNPQDWDFKKWVEWNRPTEKDLKEYSISGDQLSAIKMWGDLMYRLRKKKMEGFPLWNYAMKERIPKKGLPDWKINFHNKNKEFYKNNKSIVDYWRKKHNIGDLIQSYQKFEWQAQDASRNTKDCLSGLLIQLRPSGIRVKKPTYVGALVAMVQTPVIGWEMRSITPSEAGYLQGFSRDFKRDANDKLAYKQFGNAVNTTVIKLAAKTLLRSNA